MSKCFVVKSKTIISAINQPVIPGGGLLQPFASIAAESGFPMKILEDVAQWRDAEVHVHEGDFWICLQGEARFVYGGELVNPQFRLNVDGSENKNELYAKEIVNGTEIVLQEGDYFWIPPGEPHQHGSTGTTRLGIIKIPQ